MITEKEAREILMNTDLIQRGDLQLCINKIIDDWKEKGYIEKSALEKFKDFYNHRHDCLKLEVFDELYELAMAVIEELQNK